MQEAIRTMLRIVAFIPGASPPVVATAIFLKQDFPNETLDDTYNGSSFLDGDHDLRV